METNLFMNGVTLIKECTELSDKGVIVSFVVRIAAIALLFILLRVVFTWSRNHDPYSVCTVGAVLAVIIFIVCRFLLDTIIPNIFQETIGEFEVVLDDDVDMNEFCKRYEIIDFEDGKYTIKFKEE